LPVKPVKPGNDNEEGSAQTAPSFAPHFPLPSQQLIRGRVAFDRGPVI
jgi:hypothetical protein